MALEFTGELGLEIYVNLVFSIGRCWLCGALWDHLGAECSRRRPRSGFWDTPMFEGEAKEIEKKNLLEKISGSHRSPCTTPSCWRHISWSHTSSGLRPRMYATTPLVPKYEIRFAQWLPEVWGAVHSLSKHFPSSQSVPGLWVGHWTRAGVTQSTPSFSGQHDKATNK